MDRCMDLPVYVYVNGQLDGDMDGWEDGWIFTPHHTSDLLLDEQLPQSNEKVGTDGQVAHRMRARPTVLSVRQGF